MGISLVDKNRKNVLKGMFLFKLKVPYYIRCQIFVFQPRDPTTENLLHALGFRFLLKLMLVPSTCFGGDKNKVISEDKMNSCLWVLTSTPPAYLDAYPWPCMGSNAICEITKSWFQELCVVVPIFLKRGTSKVEVKDGLYSLENMSKRTISPKR